MNLRVCGGNRLPPWLFQATEGETSHGNYPMAPHREDKEMQETTHDIDTERYARCINASKQVRWDIDKDVIRGRGLDFSSKFLPDGLSRVNEIDFLDNEERCLLSRIQGRTYLNIFGLVERFITAKVLELSSHHWTGDQTALESLVRFGDEELKHQELFRRMDEMAAAGMSDGYSFLPDPDEVAKAVLEKSNWAVLALTLHIELFTQLHYRESIEPDHDLSELFKDVFLFHWKEESQHAILDELEWKRLDEALTADERDRAVNEFIELLAAVDAILQDQAALDAGHFMEINKRVFSMSQQEVIRSVVLKAYRWQYIFYGAQHPRFLFLLGHSVSPVQGKRINDALATIT